MSTNEETVETTGELEKDTRPEYVKDKPPKGKTNYAKWALLHGKTEEQLVAEGANPGTVRVAAQELEKEGLRRRPKEKPGTEVIPVGKPGGMQVFAKGSPPEAIIESISLPVMANGEGPLFEKGIKFGASMIVLGVRVAQELTNLGVQQAKPIMEMAKGMREGEAMAAKSAAGEAAMTAAALVQQNLQPYLANLSRPPAGPNPMQEMMARLMEPAIQQMISKMMPGAVPSTPSGWSKRAE